MQKKEIYYNIIHKKAFYKAYTSSAYRRYFFGNFLVGSTFRNGVYRYAQTRKHPSIALSKAVVGINNLALEAF